MSRAWPYMPGVPAAGHVTSRGFWHPGRIEGCRKCPDPLGNSIAREGCDRCYCGVKYWENDRCVDCGTHISVCLRDPEWRRENR